MRRLAPAAAGLSALLALAACGGGASAAPPTPTGPTSGTVTDRSLPSGVLDLPLTDADGSRVTLRHLAAGGAVVVTDFLTTCQEVCPMTSVDMRDAADQARRQGLADRVRFVEITVDPERDDRARLAAYRALFGATRPNWSFATSSPASIAQVWSAFGVSYSRAPEDDPPATDWLTGKPLTYDVTHQDAVFLVDREGHERWLEIGQPDTRGQAPPPVLARFLNDEGRKNLASPDGPVWTAGDVEDAVAWWLRTAAS